MKLLKHLFLIVLLTVTFNCNVEDVDPKYAPAPGSIFDIDLFQQNIETNLGEQWKGYSYIISKEGKAARLNTKGNWSNSSTGIIEADFTTPVYLASVNKFVMAVAILKAMDEEGSGASNMLDTSISPYLPNWQIHNNTLSLTWRDVLTHRTGFSPNFNSDFQNLSNMLSGSTASSNSTYSYSNGNFGLLRYLLAELTGTAMGSAIEFNDNLTKTIYLNYLNTNIFNNIQIDPAQVTPSQVRYYNVNDDLNVNGWNIGNRSDNLGAGGLYMSAYDLSSFISYLNHTEHILTNETRDLLYNDFLGLSDGADPRNNPLTGDKGTYFTKGGSLNNGNPGPFQGVSNRVMMFPNDVEIVFLGNTRGVPVTGGSLTNAILQAYDDAWE